MVVVLFLGTAFFSLGDDFGTPAREEAHAGLLWDVHPVSLEPGSRTEAAGPLVYHQTDDLANTWALPPFFSRTEWINGHGCEYDFLYPLLTYDRYGQEYRWQLGQLLSFAGGQNQRDASQSRFTLFPFYFQQRSPEPELNYTALWPIYGHLQNRIFRTETDFALWPLYVKSVKRANLQRASTFLTPPQSVRQPRTGEITTYNYLLPLFHLRYADGLFGWQLWPLLGHEHKEATTKTNSWGDAELVPGHDKRFYLWPFYHQQARGIAGENPERELLLFPLYDRLRSPLRDTTSYLTPFGLTFTADRGRKYQEVALPWPLIVFAWGEGKTNRRIWPLFGRAHTKGFASNFYLWPAYSYRRKQGETLDRERTRLFYFLFSRTTDKNTETGAKRSRTDLWPLFTHERAADGRSRLQVFAPLEPILPASKSIVRNYSPLWSLWRTERNPVTGAHSQSLLWNLYRSQLQPAPPHTAVAPAPAAASKTERNLFSLFASDSKDEDFSLPPPPHSSGGVTGPATKKVSLLFGLFQYESTGKNRRWRVFYLPLNPSQKVSAHVPEHR